MTDTQENLLQEFNVTTYTTIYSYELFAVEEIEKKLDVTYELLETKYFNPLENLFIFITTFKVCVGNVQLYHKHLPAVLHLQQSKQHIY